MKVFLYLSKACNWSARQGTAMTVRTIQAWKCPVVFLITMTGKWICTHCSIKEHYSQEESSSDTIISSVTCMRRTPHILTLPHQLICKPYRLIPPQGVGATFRVWCACSYLQKAEVITVLYVLTQASCVTSWSQKSILIPLTHEDEVFSVSWCCPRGLLTRSGCICMHFTFITSPSHVLRYECQRSNMQINNCTSSVK